MGALTIAFDTTIVGALALPWVLLVIHLFFFEGEDRLESVLDWVKDQGQPAAAGVLLFAITYTLGSAVSRTAADFFNDDDLHIQFGGHNEDQHIQVGGSDEVRHVRVGGHLFRVGVTEGRLLTRVYCDANQSQLLSAGQASPATLNTINTFRTFPEREKLCKQTLSWSVGAQTNWQDEKLNKAAEDLFGLEENALMEKGGDYNVRLRQLHDQIMVLRGAAFNGFIGFSLCVFAWGVNLRREKPRSWLRLALLPVPALYSAVALIATLHHFGERAPSDPPYMEFTLLLLAMVGAWLVWKPSSSSDPARANLVPAKQVLEKQTLTVTAKDTADGNEAEKKCHWQIEHWERLVVLSAILTVAAALGWWSTEVVYGEQVVYSYDSQGTVAPQK